MIRVFAVILGVLLPVVGLTQPVLKIQPIQIKSNDLVVAFLHPPWAVTGDLAKHSEMDRQTGPTGTGTVIDRFEFIPKGESFDNWSELYAFSTETNVALSVRDVAETQIAIYEQACDSQRAQIVAQSDEKVVFYVACSAYKGQKRGEMAAFAISKNGSTLVKHYYHQRGPKFNLNNSKTFPIPQNKMMLILRIVNASATQTTK